MTSPSKSQRVSIYHRRYSPDSWKHPNSNCRRMQIPSAHIDFVFGKISKCSGLTNTSIWCHLLVIMSLFKTLFAEDGFPMRSSFAGVGQIPKLSNLLWNSRSSINKHTICINKASCGRRICGKLTRSYFTSKADSPDETNIYCLLWPSGWLDLEDSLMFRLGTFVCLIGSIYS